MCWEQRTVQYRYIQCIIYVYHVRVPLWSPTDNDEDEARLGGQQVADNTQQQDDGTGETDASAAADRPTRAEQEERQVKDEEVHRRMMQATQAATVMAQHHRSNKPQVPPSAPQMPWLP